MRASKAYLLRHPSSDLSITRLSPRHRWGDSPQSGARRPCDLSSQKGKRFRLQREKQAAFMWDTHPKHRGPGRIPHAFSCWTPRPPPCRRGCQTILPGGAPRSDGTHGCSGQRTNTPRGTVWKLTLDCAEGALVFISAAACRLSLAAVSRHARLTAACGLLVAAFSPCRARAPGTRPSAGAAPGVFVAHRLGLLRPGTEPLSPAFAGEFFPAGPPGKPGLHGPCFCIAC